MSTPLSELYDHGLRTEATFVAKADEMREVLNRRHNVITHPDQFSGWRLIEIRPWKSGVLRYAMVSLSGHTCLRGFVQADIYRVAIETGVTRKP